MRQCELPYKQIDTPPGTPQHSQKSAFTTVLLKNTLFLKECY